MLIVSLLMLSICIGTILLIIHGGDEIHQLVAFLSAIIACTCIFILIPPTIKALISLGVLTFGCIKFPIYK